MPEYFTWGLDGPLSPDAPIFRWSPGTVPLTLRPARALAPGNKRLVVEAGDGTERDEFLVDTGTSGCVVSYASPLARALRFPKTPVRFAMQGPPLHPGGRSEATTAMTPLEEAALPLLRMGPVEGRWLKFGLTARSPSRANPRNVIGLDAMQGAALVRSDTGWTLETGPRIAWRSASSVPLERVGLPVVTLHDSTSKVIHALVDTGAPKCEAFTSAGTGPWRLTATDGRTPLIVPRAHDAGTNPNLSVGGIQIDFVLGIEALDHGLWRVDFERGVWEFMG